MKSALDQLISGLGENETLSTTEVAASLGVSAPKARAALDKHKDVVRFGYRDSDGSLQYLEAFENPPKRKSIVWQFNCTEE